MKVTSLLYDLGKRPDTGIPKSRNESEWKSPRPIHLHMALAAPLHGARGE